MGSQPDRCIELCGAGPGNKGAELMLAAACAHLSWRHPRLRLACDPGMGDYAYRARHGLWQLLGNGGRRERLLAALMGPGYRQRFGLLEPRQRVALLDLSGYALGDPWKPEWVEARARHFESVRASGGRVILLPQALGPFARPRVRDAARRAMAAADLVFARDPKSHVAARELLGDAPNLRLAPDFTNLLAGTPVPGYALGDGHVALVPNRQMLVHGDAAVQAGYVAFFAAAASAVLAAGLKPFLLLHELRADRPLAEAIAAEVEVSLPIVAEPDALRLKGIIGACEFIIGSRFHALVSALSQAVPAIGTSWSHKYEYLYADYGQSGLLLRPEGAAAVSSAASLQQLLDPQRRAQLRAALLEAAEAQKARARAMWREVDALLEFVSA